MRRWVQPVLLGLQKPGYNCVRHWQVGGGRVRDGQSLRGWHIQGLPNEHPNAPVNMGLSGQELDQVQNATQVYVQQMVVALAAKGKYVWNAMSGASGLDGYLGRAPNQGDCVSQMNKWCTPEWQLQSMTMQWGGPSPNQTLAAFLIARGPMAYIGYGANGHSLPPWDPLFDLDFGEPLGLCNQTSPGVYTRAWTSANVTLNCTSWTADLGL